MGGVRNIEFLKREILEQAKQQSSAIIDRAQRVAERDIQYALEEAEEIRKQQREKVSPLVEMEKKKIIASAEMEARKRLLEKKEELVSRVFQEVENKIYESRNSRSYSELITKLIEDGISAIDGDLIIEYGESDSWIFTKEFISNIDSKAKAIKSADVKLKFIPMRNYMFPGVIIRSADGKVVVDNTLPSILKRLKDELRGKISEILLSEHD